MDNKPRKIIQDVVAIRRLRAILWFELSTVVLFIFSFLGPFTIAIIIIAALLFTPYMLFVLIKEKRYSWITMFFIMVVLPCILILLMFYDFVLLSAWLVVPFILFLFYCFILKYSVADWLKEYYTHEEYEEQKKESAKRKQDEMGWSP